MPTTTQRSKSRGASQRRSTTRGKSSASRSKARTSTARPSLRRKQPQSKGRQILGALTSAVPAGNAAGRVRSGASKAPAKGLALLGAAGGLAAVLKRRGKSAGSTPSS